MTEKDSTPGATSMPLAKTRGIDPLDHGFCGWLRDVRQWFHQHPETMFEEVNTTARIQKILTDLGIEHYGFEDMTGVVALIRGGQPGKTIGLRADIDALPIEEQTDVPYRSLTPGKMHACGHDAHTTIMLGVARYLVESQRAGQLKGNVKLMFQPAEEGDGAADLMIRKGVLEDPRVDRILACHMHPSLDVGTVGVCRSQSHASTDPFVLVIHGRGGHGARPNQAIDPIAAGAFLVAGLQTIVSRNIDPLDTAVVHVGKFVSGDAGNVVPARAELAGTIRALDPKVREQVVQRFKEMVKGLELQFGVTCDLTLNPGYPACINDTRVSGFLADVSATVVGKENIHYLRPSTGGEDFAFFAQARPSAMIMLGCRNEAKGIVHPLHSSRFNLDEAVLETGVRIFAQAVCRYLS